MQQFSARMFYWAGVALETIKVDCLMRPGGAGGDEALPATFFHQPIDQRTRGKALESLRLIETECRGIRLVITADTIRELIENIEQNPAIQFYWLFQQVATIQKLIQKEMSTALFLYISPERAAFWPKTKQPNIFGDDVATAFPSTTYDISRAGISLATRMTTASVFHLMRALEIALGTLGSKFGVSLAHTNWAPAIEEIETKIRHIHKDPAWRDLPDCKEQQEFYAQAASYFGVIKDAWRNYTMHARAKYTEEEAENIFNNVKGFMKKLAERLSE